MPAIESGMSLSSDCRMPRRLTTLRTAVPPGQEELGVPYRYDRAHGVEDDELVQAVHEERQDVARHHLPALGPVEDGAADIPQQDGYRRGDDGRQGDPGYADYVPARDEDQAYLARHRAEHHAEVEPHPGHDGQEERQHEEGVAAEPAQDFLDEVLGGQAREGDGHGDQDGDHDHHRVVDKEEPQLSFHLATFVFLVRA